MSNYQSYLHHIPIPKAEAVFSLELSNAELRKLGELLAICRKLDDLDQIEIETTEAFAKMIERALDFSLRNVVITIKAQG